MFEKSWLCTEFNIVTTTNLPDSALAADMQPEPRYVILPAKAYRVNWDRERVVGDT